MTLYTSLAELKSQIGTKLSGDDNIVLADIRQVSSRIDRMFTKRPASMFAPSIETRNNYRMSADRVNSSDGTFYMGEPLLSLSAVSVGTQTVTPGTVVTVYQGEVSPYLTLALVNPCCNSWYRYGGCDGCGNIPFVSIAGTWGYNSDYTNAWVNTTQTVTNAAGMDATQTTFTVTDADSANSLGLTPAFSPGNLAQIDTEWMEVTAVDTTTNTVTVRRGVNGSAAAGHALGAAVYTFQVEECIRRACYRQVGLIYAKVGSYDNKTITNLADVDFAADVLAEFSALLTLFANM